MTDRRKLVKALTIAGAGGQVAAWKSPVVDSLVLPAHAFTSGAGCIAFTDDPSRYVDFDGGNYISSSTPYYLNSTCTSIVENVGCNGFAYAPGGIEQAHAICQENAGVNATDENFENDVYSCGCVGPSDIRLKTDIQSLGKSDTGFNLYRYRYIGDQSGTEYVGVMAQDLIDTHPHALVKYTDGYFRVKYGLLGMRMQTYEEWIQSRNSAAGLMH